jgi:hypothetical protein
MKQPSFLIYDISFYLYCAAAVGNLAFLIFMTVRSADKHYDAINRWDLIYHAHNLGAHICSIVSIVNMWRPKGFVRSPMLSIVHFVATEAVKLYFAAEWSTYWPQKNSTDWLVYQVGALNTTGDPDKIAIFNWFTETYDIEWVPDSDPRFAPWWNSSTTAFLEWCNARAYDMVPPVLALASVTSFIGLVACALAYVDFLRKVKAKKRPAWPVSEHLLPTNDT